MGFLQEGAATGVGSLDAIEAISSSRLSGGADVDGGNACEWDAETVPA